MIAKTMPPRKGWVPKNNREIGSRRLKDLSAAAFAQSAGSPAIFAGQFKPMGE
jgi:hypothetical protein